ncbi:hypothetical protein [Streptomyces sp. NPDC090025]|uniref:hypothetical protein n=1 Tax=Streptomyces sp. NPDC090025 TaxID=3365922 RepID=UPI003838F39E
MSQPVPPPGNPFAQGAEPAQPTAPQAAPQTGNPFAQGAEPLPQPPFAPAAPARSNMGLGLVAALVAALVAGGAYGGIAGAIEREIGWAAVGVGFLVGFAAGKAGGRNPVLPVVSAVLSLGAVYLGQLLAVAILVGKQLNISVGTILTDHLDAVQALWKEDLDPLTFLFFALAAFAAFSGSKKAAE